MIYVANCVVPDKDQEKLLIVNILPIQPLKSVPGLKA